MLKNLLHFGESTVADIAVPRQDLQCTRALVHLAEFAKSMRTLGSYASWKEKN